MKKTLIWIGGSVAVAAIGWSALWFLGRSELSKQIDRELARAEAQGQTVTWGIREIGGFPDGYDLRLTDVAVTDQESGILLQIPEVRSRLDAASIERIEADVLGEIRITAPIAEETRQTDPRLPPVVNLLGENDGLRLSVEIIAGARRDLRVTAERSVWRVDQEDFPNRIVLETDGVESRQTDRGSDRVANIALDRLKLEVDGDADGEAARVEYAVEDLSITTTTTAATLDELLAIVAGGEGSAELVYQSGRIDALAETGDPAGSDRDRFSYTGLSGTGIITVADGRLEVRTEGRENVWTADPAGSPSMLRGSIEAEAIQTSYAMPIAAQSTPEAANLRFSAINVAGDEVLWAQLDPARFLDRAPSEMIIDIETTARVTGSYAEAAAQGRLPVEFSNIIVNEVAVSALGGAIQASGDIELLQPLNLPMGSLNVTLTKIASLIDALHRAQLIDDEVRTTADAMLEIYTLPGDDAETRVTQMGFGTEGLTINGLAIP
ncbi:MAG: DUF2125 domain-containing protein [Pseudomonadota bacterium]